LAHGDGGRVGRTLIVTIIPQGSVERCVVWPGAWVGPDEQLRDVIRAGTRDDPITVGG